MIDLFQFLTPKLLLPLAVLAAIFCFVGYYWRVIAPRRGTLEWIAQERSRPDKISFRARRHPMQNRDVLPLILLTLVYAFTAFFQLGSLSAPQSALDLNGGKSVTVELTEDTQVSKLWYFSGLGTGGYNVEVSSDGERWSTLWTHRDEEGKITSYYWADAQGYSPSYALPQAYSDLFKWQEIIPDNPLPVRYLRITGRADRGQSLLELNELVLFDQDGAPLPASRYRSGAGDPLFDEGDTIPSSPSWFNSAYFDEIYHPRTAYEHVRGVYPYELSHPPLGKLIIGLGVGMFGMTPFGWRFMGTLFGVLMLPLLYIFLKNMFGKTPVAVCGTALFAFDFLHLTQTRLATIDTYAVFFILAAYFFLYRYLTLPAGASFRRGAGALFLSGLSWGLGAACKWTVFYAGIGLAVLYFIGLWYKRRDWPGVARPDGPRPPLFGPWLAKTLLFSVLCFVLIPFAIYTLSYIPYAKALGVDLFAHSEENGLLLLLQNTWGKLTFSGEGTFAAKAIPQDNLFNIMCNNQWYMFTYHSGVSQPHPYASRWYQWIVDARPILYYMDNTAAATTRFSAFNNPVVCWAGLLSMISVAAHAFRHKWAKFLYFALSGVIGSALVLHTDLDLFNASTEEGVFRLNGSALVLLLVVLAIYLALGAWVSYLSERHSGKALFILVGWLSQLVPWMLIRRPTFEYHYFPALIFLVLAICYLMNGIMERKDIPWKVPVYGLTGLGVAAFVLFYPGLIGLTMPTWYSNWFLGWLPSWPF